MLAMSEIVKRLRERRQSVWEDMKALADRAADENRNFEADEQGQWDAMNDELEKLDTRIKSALDTEKRAKEADEAFERLGRSGGGEVRRNEVGVPAASDQDLDARFRQLARGECRDITVALPTAFERRALTGGVELRAPVGTSAAPMPTTFIHQLYRFLVDTSSIRQANPRVFTTQTGENLTVPRSTAEGAAAWVAELGTIGDAYPTLSSVTLGAHKVARTSYLSRELVDDNGFDLLGFLAEEMGRQVGITVDAAYVNGDGSGKPSGFVDAATVGFTGDTGATAVIKATDLFEVYHSIIPQYRARASWVMHDSTIKAVRQLRDGSGGTDTTGQFLWQPGLQAGQPDMLLGRPVYADPNMPPMAVSAKSIAFGDFGGYWVRDVSPLRFDRSDEFKFDTDAVSFRITYRTDGKLGDTNAIKLFQHGAAA